MTSPIVSVIIPAYNASQTVQLTVFSVLQQTFQDFEIIIVDDGSKDDTLSVARSIKDSRVKVIRQSNGGASSARNTGIKAATGKYVAFLDADDLWLPNKLQLQLDALASVLNVRAVQCGVYYVDNSLNVINIRPCVISKDQLLETLLFQNLPGLMSTLFMERNVFEEIGLLDTGLVILEDWELAIRIARHCNFSSIEDPLTLYRQYPGNRSLNLDIHIEPGFTILGRLFADPALPLHIKKQKTFIYSSFFRMLCGGAFKAGQYGESAKWGIKALIKHPRSFPYIALTPLRKLQRNPSLHEIPAAFELAVRKFREYM